MVTILVAKEEDEAASHASVGKYSNHGQLCETLPTNRYPLCRSIPATVHVDRTCRPITLQTNVAAHYRKQRELISSLSKIESAIFFGILP